MSLFSSLPPPPNGQSIADIDTKKDKDQKVTDIKPRTNWTWQDWFQRLWEKLSTITVLPTLGSSNQLLGVNAAGTDLEYKTLGVQSVAGTLPAVSGGTGLNSFAVGDILYADTTTTLARLADVSAGSFLRSGGVATAPVWSTTKWTNSATIGDLLAASAANTYSNIAAVATGQLLKSAGVGTLPAWGTFSATGDATGTYGAAGLPLTLATVNANVGTFGSATQVGQFTVNAKGLITAASNVTITGVPPGGPAGGDLSGTYPNPSVQQSRLTDLWEAALIY